MLIYQEGQTSMAIAWFVANMDGFGLIIHQQMIAICGSFGAQFSPILHVSDTGRWFGTMEFNDFPCIHIYMYI